MVFSLLIASCLNAPIRVYSIGILISTIDIILTISDFVRKNICCLLFIRPSFVSLLSPFLFCTNRTYIPPTNKIKKTYNFQIITYRQRKMVYIPPSVSFCSWTNNQKATQYYGDANPQYEVFSISLY